MTVDRKKEPRMKSFIGLVVFVFSMSAHAQEVSGDVTGYHGQWSAGVQCSPILGGALPFSGYGVAITPNSIKGSVQVGYGSYPYTKHASWVEFQPKHSYAGSLQMYSTEYGVTTGLLQLSGHTLQMIAYAKGITLDALREVCVSSIEIDAVTTVWSLSQNQPSVGYINQAIIYLNMDKGEKIGPIVF